MTWAIIGIITFIVVVVVLALVYVHDRRYEERSVVETMNPSTWDEIAKEREENLLKARKFKEAIEKARRFAHTLKEP